MWKTLRKAVAPTVVVMLGSYGLAFAATGSPNPVDLVSNHGQAAAHVSPKPSHTPETDDPSGPPHTPKADKTPKPSHGPERSTVGCPDGFTGNHGQFVSQSDDKQAAAKSDCGKPVPAVSPASSDDHGDDSGTEVEHGDDKKPESSDAPDADATGDAHSNNHTGNGGEHGND